MAKRRKYFYLNDQLHKTLFVNRGRDLLWAWNYPEHKRNTYTYSDVVRRMEPCFRTSEVAKILHRDKTNIDKTLFEGHIPYPQYAYNLESGLIYAYMWSEKDILTCLEYLSTIHYGRPRKDGMIVPKYLPTPREVRAIIRDDKDRFGTPDYKPSFRAKVIKGEK